MLPTNQSAILSGGYSPWQAPLAALFSGISAAAQPGGFANFGVGTQQGIQNFQQGQQQQQLMDLRRMQIEQAQEEQRRANQEEAQRQAKIDLIKQTLAGSAGSPTTQHGNYGAATGGAPQGQSAILSGMTPQQSALFSTYAQVDPEGAFSMLADNAFAQPKAANAPEIQNFYEGGNVVQKQWNPQTQQWDVVGQGPRFAPTQGGGGLSIAAPVWGVDENGNAVIMQLSPTGEAVQTKLPSGVKVVRPNVQVDTGTGTAMVSPVTGQASNVIPKDVAGEQAQQEIGTATGKVAAGLPDAIAKAEEANSLIDSLKSHPGRKVSTGFSSVIPTVPGTDQADFVTKLDQLKGTVFLQAYSQLRGGGAITEVEGQKAEQAIARLNRAQSENEFVKSLDELKEVINSGIARMKKRASGNVQPNESNVVPELPEGFE